MPGSVNYYERVYTTVDFSDSNELVRPWRDFSLPPFNVTTVCGARPFRGVGIDFVTCIYRYGSVSETMAGVGSCAGDRLQTSPPAEGPVQTEEVSLRRSEELRRFRQTLRT